MGFIGDIHELYDDAGVIVYGTTQSAYQEGDGNNATKLMLAEYAHS